jgi:uncharacterized Zn finger protein (UPF0148 family)
MARVSKKILIFDCVVLRSNTNIHVPMNIQYLLYTLAILFMIQLVAPQNLLAQLSREEKNTMTTCPLHSKRMNLSENYRANASDFRQSEDYPFAYQLNYRRFCPICTKTLSKEEARFNKQDRSVGGKATFERCEVHNEYMKTNAEFSSVNSTSDRNREKDIIHAKQYRGRLYCKSCSKIYSIRAKDKAAEEKEDE